MQLVPYRFGATRVVLVLTVATSDAVADEGRPIQVNRFGWAIRLGWRFATRAGNAKPRIVNLRFPLVGLACSVAILFIALSVVNGFERAMREDILSRVPHAVVTSAMEPQIDHEWQTWLSEHPLVAHTSPYVEVSALLTANDNLMPVRLEGISTSLERSTNPIFSDVLEGSFGQLESGRFRIAISQYLANKLGVVLGDKVSAVLPPGSANLFSASPRQRSLEVAVIFNSRSDLDHAAVITSVETATRLGGSSSPAGFKVTLVDLFSGSDLVTAMRETPSMPSMRISLWQHRYGSLYAAIALQKQILFLLLSVVVLLAAFSLAAHFVVSIESRSKTPQSCARLARASDILGLYLAQGLWQCALAIGAGLLIGRALLPLVSYVLDKSEDVLGVQLLSEYFVHYLPYDCLAQDAILIVGLSLLLGFIAHIYPAWRATKTSPSVELAHHKSF